MSIAADLHLRRFAEQPVLLQEFERWLRNNEFLFADFERMAFGQTTIEEGTTRIDDDLYVWFRKNRTWTRPEATLLRVLEKDDRPNGRRHMIQNFRCALLCGVIFTPTQNGDALVMQLNLTEPTGHWELADDNEMGNAALRLMIVNRA